jgi:WXG100 family type VII secretion target
MGAPGGNDRDMNVDPAKMAQGKALVTTASGEVKTMLNQLQTEVEELLHGWQSKGSKGFYDAHQAWTSKAAIINNALDDLGVKLGVVGVHPGAADDSVHGSFGPLTA